MANSIEEDDLKERRDAEIALLEAMYPSGISWHGYRQEITYKADSGGLLLLRVPDGYPGDDHPQLISAVDKNKNDIRNKFRIQMEDSNLPRGEEILDAIIQAFNEILNACEESVEISTHQSTASESAVGATTHYKTVIIWLHHLLNTNKRKLALSPTIDASEVAGATKPGYPGVLLYSGTANAVDKHVAELKDQRWQAFQVRYEEMNDSVWTFHHGSSIKEYESISELTQSMSSERNREMFLKAIGIK